MKAKVERDYNYRELSRQLFSFVPLRLARSRDSPQRKSSLFCCSLVPDRHHGNDASRGKTPLPNSHWKRTIGGKEAADDDVSGGQFVRIIWLPFPEMGSMRNSLELEIGGVIASSFSSFFSSWLLWFRILATVRSIRRPCVYARRKIIPLNSVEIKVGYGKGK